MEQRGSSLTGSLELASAFSTQINTGVPVEIVEAENQADSVLRSENGAQNISAEDAMEISVEGDPQAPGLDSTQLSAASRSVGMPVSSEQTVAGAVMAGVALSADMTSNVSHVVDTQVGQMGMDAISSTDSLTVTAAQSQSLLSSANFPSGLTQSAASMLSATQNSSQLTRTVMEQLSDAQGLEISSEAISSLSLPGSSMGGGRGYPMPQMSSYSSTPNVSSLMASRGHRDLLTSNYSDLDLSVGASATATLDGLNEPDSPSSPESNFDSSELLSNPLTHQDEVTQRLAQSGPIGIAAAAAITSSARKRKRLHTFETNPSFRKRHCSKLTKKLKETIDELAARVGLQAVVVTYRPGKGNGKNEPSFKVFGAAPLVNIVKNQRDSIVNEMEAALHQQAPTIATPPTTQQGDPMFELPALVFDGIPTPVHKMTQAQLRTFIPNMLKFSTGRGKPGWGKDDVRPPWWPDDVPWANVRSDIRSNEQKKALQWTDALRRIVINCYLHHGRMDLLPEFSLDLLQQYLTPQVAEQIQVQLDSLQQQQDSVTSAAGHPSINPDAAAEEVAAALTEITEASGGVEGRDDPEMMVGESQQVFTVDTGIGNCDMAGMPTLADASLAETAARLQQLADETGEVQYATQTVTVTDRDAKALGQPVGSTTTVLLTAYPGGHSGAASTAVGGGDAATMGGAEQQPSNPTSDAAVEAAVTGSQQFLTSTTPPSNGAGNVQVVYSASHIDPIPDSITSNPANPDLAAEFTSPPSTQVSSGIMGGATMDGLATSQADANAVSMGVSDYLNPTNSQEVLMPHADSNVGTSSEADTTNDLAAELIREYSLGTETLDGKPNQLASLGGSSETTGTKSPES